VCWDSTRHLAVNRGLRMHTCCACTGHSGLTGTGGVWGAQVGRVG
jgi:hypothetical protein